MTAIYIHKYALSDCIRKADIELMRSSDGSEYADMGYCVYLREGKDWCRTEHEAVKAAEAARIKKVASVKKQLARLEAMTFVVKDYIK